ncbi:MAG TPA: NADH-quinone oxidoreductase subunit K [Feifaniaceae bacterium]|nr:NADH-quinone oxidoreductase subunit K [Feifaniaceae bacterium]
MNELFLVFLIAVALLLVTGIYCLIVSRNLMRILLSVEILAKGTTLLMIAVGYVTGNMAQAQAYVLTIIVIEVVLVVVATGIVLGIYRETDVLDTRKLNNLKG